MPQSSRAFSLAYGPAYDGGEAPLPVGAAALWGIDRTRAGATVEAARGGLAARLVADGARIDERVERFDGFFRQRGHRCPLPHQLRKTRTQGLPRIDPLVDALLLLEMSHGLLMGIQDLARVEGTLVYDRAAAGEGFAGMRGAVSCGDGEPVVRDGAGIIAAYFQGPDHRTRITAETRDLLFLAFAAPGIPAAALHTALDEAVELLALAAAGSQTTVLGAG
jgi:DNA/RNA-binding domain of Phe-tRNA-synthetase-like protein